jgi:hypothetical protein
MRKIKIQLCEIAEKDHEMDMRNYAHTFHRKNTICICEDFLNLPDRYFWAIMIHEIGHLLVGKNGSEKDANRAAEEYFGVKVYCLPKTYYGKKLEFVAGDLGFIKKVISLLNKLSLQLIYGR